MQFAFVRTLGLAFLVLSSPPIEGVVIDARTRLPIAGAEVMIVGQRGSERSGPAGRFRWDPAGLPPFVVIVVLPDGRVARPIQVARLDLAEGPALIVESAVSEALTVTGAAPTVDVPAGASTTWLSGEQMGSEHPATFSQSLLHVAGVSTIAEGQGAVPAVRGLARGRTLILLDEGRVSTERRAGPNASFLDPEAIRSVEVARGPGSVAYGSDAFGGVIAVQTRRPDRTGAVQRPVFQHGRRRAPGEERRSRGGQRLWQGWDPGVLSWPVVRRLPRAGRGGAQFRMARCRWAGGLGARHRREPLVGKVATRSRPRDWQATQ